MPQKKSYTLSDIVSSRPLSKTVGGPVKKNVSILKNPHSKYSKPKQFKMFESVQIFPKPVPTTQTLYKQQKQTQANIALQEFLDKLHKKIQQERKKTNTLQKTKSIKSKNSTKSTKPITMYVEKTKKK